MALAAEGYALAIHCLNSRVEGIALAKAIIDGGGRAEVLTGDLADMDAVAALVPEARAALGPLSLLVNSASEFSADAVGSLDKAHWDRQFAINLQAPVFLTQAFAEQIAPDAADPSVVNLIDQRVLSPRPDYFSYYLSKAGLFTATQTMAQALAPRVRVNGIGPGPTFRNHTQTQADFEGESAATPLGHGSSGEDIAQAVLYLAKARSVTGQMIAVDGGQHLAWAK
jgi:NAD(P)-dependent dehydrogenase (short-subunit alcohol dehydrogenase family)